MNSHQGKTSILDGLFMDLLKSFFSSFLDLNLSAFTDTFGFFGGLYRYLKNIGEDLFVHSKAHARQPRIHPIAVSEEVRGKGSGEREGYVKYRYLPTSVFTSKAGFDGIII
ncbi:hypothetical protein acsn021_23770 [Anaerocolumna cellulosilytica]|uniref:Uncharacterized protein n=1 Tax=Anaerocolumna cellulosilytica TaxID=433286 RepID=A0A6S6R729_9FIRM|nr:hypothetical protein [Anaerocolumna cellulosilytica]MBB5193978.1 hypothetical protein [Anaerocolumna cellulosilytica]BCJ94808.1 hypothetical protein acsn021_23770 [Anaerocolumna cellulosilytica]